MGVVDTFEPGLKEILIFFEMEECRGYKMTKFKLER
jgi:hypothetical protein